MRKVIKAVLSFYSGVSRSDVIGYIDEVLDITSKHALVALIMIAAVAVLTIDTINIVSAKTAFIMFTAISLLILIRVASKTISYGYELLSKLQGVRSVKCFPLIAYIGMYVCLLIYTLIIAYVINITIFINTCQEQRLVLTDISNISIPYTLLMITPVMIPATLTLMYVLYELCKLIVKATK